MRTASLCLASRLHRTSSSTTFTPARYLGLLRPHSCNISRTGRKYSSSTALCQSSSHDVSIRGNPLTSCCEKYGGRVLDKSGARHKSTSVVSGDASSKSSAGAVGVAGHQRNWMKLSFEPFLPPNLRTTSKSKKEQEKLPIDIQRIARLFTRAEQRDMVVFEWMVLNDQAEAAVWLMEELLSDVAARTNCEADKHPSNIDWEGSSIRSHPSSKVDGTELSYTPSQSPVDVFPEFTEAKFFRQYSLPEHIVLNTIWETLGRLVVHSTRTGHKNPEKLMQVVLLIIAKAHSLDMIPHGLYGDEPAQTDTIQLPQILHLVSSRVLAALSDAVWRRESDKSIQALLDAGRTLEQIGRDPPGGVYRLRPTPLEPEIWLEMILWYCIESGYTIAATRIVQFLKQQVEQPWFAVRWVNSEQDADKNILVDWERVKSRFGGPGGSIEAYSGDAASLTVPKHTVSVEAILALVEAILNSCNAGIHQPGGVARSLTETMSDIEQAISFLEPHDLPSQYFDYLANRLMQSGAFDVVGAPAQLQTWSKKLQDLRRLESVKAPTLPARNLDLDSVLSHGQQQSALQQQALDGLIQIGDIHSALQDFNDLVEHIDEVKYDAISEFLNAQTKIPKSNEEVEDANFVSEYADSYGSLPYYKMAGFLNLISDTNLTSLGQWMIYSEELDGAFIPESAYSDSALSAALFRFAAASNDRRLISKVQAARNRDVRRSPSIRVLRSLVNANLSLFEISEAKRYLLRLRRAKAGGPSVSNLVQLGASILRLEQDQHTLEHDMTIQLAQAYTLLRDLITGKFDTIRSDFLSAQQIIQKQQTALALRLFAACGSEGLTNVSQAYLPTFQAGNIALLAAKDFNILLEAIVSTRGPAKGRELWTEFCRDPSLQNSDEVTSEDDYGYDQEGGVYAFDPGNTNTGLTAGLQLEADVLPGSTDDSMYTLSIESSENGLVQDDIKFADSFFQPVEDNGTRDEGDASGLELQKPKVVPVTTPNLHTLRIIVRAAVTEKERRKNENIRETADMDEILKWAVPMFRHFGQNSRAIIEQEINHPVVQIVRALAEDVEDLAPSAPIRSVGSQHRPRPALRQA